MVKGCRCGIRSLECRPVKSSSSTACAGTGSTTRRAPTANGSGASFASEARSLNRPDGVRWISSERVSRAVGSTESTSNRWPSPSSRIRTDSTRNAVDQSRPTRPPSSPGRPSQAAACSGTTVIWSATSIRLSPSGGRVASIRSRNWSSVSTPRSAPQCRTVGSRRSLRSTTTLTPPARRCRKGWMSTSMARSSGTGKVSFELIMIAERKRQLETRGRLPGRESWKASA